MCENRLVFEINITKEKTAKFLCVKTTTLTWATPKKEQRNKISPAIPTFSVNTMNAYCKPGFKPFIA